MVCWFGFVCLVFLFFCLTLKGFCAQRVKRSEKKSDLLACNSLPVFFIFPFNYVHSDFTARKWSASVSVWVLCWRQHLEVKPVSASTHPSLPSSPCFSVGRRWGNLCGHLDGSWRRTRGPRLCLHSFPLPVAYVPVSVQPPTTYQSKHRCR